MNEFQIFDTCNGIEINVFVRNAFDASENIMKALSVAIFYFFQGDLCNKNKTIRGRQNANERLKGDGMILNSL